MRRSNLVSGSFSIMLSIFLGILVIEGNQRSIQKSDIEIIITSLFFIGLSVVFFIGGLVLMFSKEPMKQEKHKQTEVEYTTGLTYNDAEYWRFNQGRKKKKN